MSAAGSPVVSVVIAAYQAERTLDAQLAALAEQRAPFAFELLVCDNGSTDGTAALARSWEDRLPVTVVDASRRRGPGAARNVGAAAATSPLLAFCDADDVVDEGWLVAMVEGLREHDFVSGASFRPERNSRPDHPVYFEFSTYRMWFLPQLPVAGAGNMGVRREVFLGVGGFDESLTAGEDLDLCWRIQLAGHPLVRAPGARVHVSNRDGLRASFRQAYAYGVGDRRLMHKYARVIAAYRAQPAPTAADARAAAPTSADGVGGRAGDAGAGDAVPGSAMQRALRTARRALRKAVSIRRPSDLSEAVHKLGTRLGTRFGSVDRSVAQVEPPTPLPRALA
jgi:glycosyltransferase involved in cell wall biosynthesis